MNAIVASATLDVDSQLARYKKPGNASEKNIKCTVERMKYGKLSNLLETTLGSALAHLFSTYIRLGINLIEL